MGCALPVTSGRRGGYRITAFHQKRAMASAAAVVMSQRKIAFQWSICLKRPLPFRAMLDPIKLALLSKLKSGYTPWVDIQTKQAWLQRWTNIIISPWLSQEAFLFHLKHNRPARKMLSVGYWGLLMLPSLRLRTRELSNGHWPALSSYGEVTGRVVGIVCCSLRLLPLFCLD